MLVAIGEDGVGFITTEVVAAALGQLATVAMTLNVPTAANVTPLTTGFCTLEVKPFGPLQVKVAPANVDANKFSVVPSHTGLLLVAIGEDGVGFTTTGVVAGALGQPFTVAITLYVPDAAVVTFVSTGF